MVALFPVSVSGTLRGHQYMSRKSRQGGLDTNIDILAYEDSSFSGLQYKCHDVNLNAIGKTLILLDNQICLIKYGIILSRPNWSV